MKKILLSTKFLAIFGSVAAVAVAAVVLVNVFSHKDEAYRIIKVYEIEGTATVNRASVGELEPYENMVLESGDLINTTDGTLTLKMDDDKYLYVEQNTELELVASGSSENSKTTINLHEGSIVNDIQNKLSDDSYYEINTPNANMMVRGTVYYVNTYVENGIRYTRVSVFDGTVSTELLFMGETVDGQETWVQQGNEVLIYEDGDKTDYVGGGARPIDYDSLPDSIKDIVDVIDERRENAGVSVSGDNAVNGPFKVTFMYNGQVFGTQTVDMGELVQQPSLMPESSGSWDYDFNSPVTEDIDIEWK